MLKEIHEAELELKSMIDCGSEGITYTVNYNGQLYAYKKLDNKKSIPNKIEKLKLFNKIKIPSNIHIVKPKAIIYNEDYNGYLMEYIDNLSLDDLIDINIEDKINILKKIKETIIFINQIGIIHGDLKCNNFLYDGLDPILIDIDNMWINNYLYDLENFFIKEYIQNCGKVDKNLDKFEFNLLTYCFINKITCFKTYKEKIRENIDTKNYKFFQNQTSKGIINNLINFSDTYQDDYLIDTLTKKA